MKTPRRARAQIALIALVALLAGPIASAAPLCIDGVNPQYFYFNGKTTALVGYSPSFVCHLAPVAASDFNGICHQNNYVAVIDELAARHLNVLRLWVGLGHAPLAKDDPNPPVFVPDGQPFAYNSATQQWDLSSAGTPQTATYFNRLKAVVSYAQLKGVIVEITLFAPYSGDFRTSPWYLGKNSNGRTGFSDEWGLVSVPGTGCGPFTSPTNIRSHQAAMVKAVVAALNEYDNIYWELANEPEMSLIRAGHDSEGTIQEDPVSLPRVIKWHECIADIIRATEGTPSAPNRHLIAANFHSKTALDTLLTGSNPNLATAVKIVSGHYVRVRDPKPGDPTTSVRRYAAIELLREYHQGPAGNLNRVFGFNEGRPTPSYKTTGSFDYITPDEARAEAWEFMLSEGGIYNHYTTDWEGAGEPVDTRVQLGKLADFLASLDLRNLRRSINNPPTWAPNLPAYGSARGSSNVYWGAMHQNGSTYVLYLHHSNLSSDAFKAYAKPASITRLTSLDLQLTPAAVNYTGQWINPATGAPIGSPFTILADGLRRSYPVEPYSYDIALKITNGTTTPSSATCAP